jgi:hypothetical protein
MGSTNRKNCSTLVIPLVVAVIVCDNSRRKKLLGSGSLK